MTRRSNKDLEMENAMYVRKMVDMEMEIQKHKVEKRKMVKMMRAREREEKRRTMMFAVIGLVMLFALVAMVFKATM